MCGIAGVYLKSPDFVRDHDGLELFANALFLGIESRGRRATGLVAVQAGGHGTKLEKADVTASDFIEARDPLPVGSRIVLLHTRYDTKGDPKNNDNNHPIVSGSTFVTHNGSVSNDTVLFSTHGLKRKAEVDTEAIAALIEKYGLDKAKFSLEKLRGSIAIAAIDPIKHPDMLVLAKGTGTPIEVLDNKDFIVWASTRKAIEEAWGLVLGTPPKWNKFHSFKEGEIWVVQDGQITKSKYDLPKYKYTPPVKKEQTVFDGATACDDAWPNPTNFGGSRSSAGVNSMEWTKKDFRKEVKAVRERGQGIARLLDENQDIVQQVTGVVRWVRCHGCTETVLFEDIRPTFAWGKMCEDCYNVAIKTQNNKYNLKDRLTDEQRLTLGNWTKIEAMIHSKALLSLSAEVEMDAGLIEWLIFRVPKTYLDAEKELNDLTADLDDMYQETLAELFEQHGIHDYTAPGETIGSHAREIGVQVVEERPFVVCGTHSEAFKEGDTCDKCESVSNVLGDSPFNARAPEPIKIRNRTVIPCLPCGKHRKQPGRVRLGRFVFCNKHFQKCNVCLGEGGLKYGLPAVGTTPDGTRLCHFCIRGKKDCLIDGNIKNRKDVIYECL